MNRRPSFVPWLLCAVVALIAYGSLYPFNFKPDAVQGGVMEALQQLSWARAGRGDRISNVLLYLPFGFCVFLWIADRLPRAGSLAIATALGALLSLAIEVAQVYVSVRVPSLTDLVLNALGSLLGAAGGWAWRVVSGLMNLPTRAEKAPRNPGAALVIGLWVLWRLAPFVPQLDLAKLKAALRPLFHPQFDLVAIFIYLTCWLVVNQAVAARVSRARRLEVLLLIIATVLVGGLLIETLTFAAAELIALLLLLPMVVVMHRLTPRPRRAALVLAVLTVLIIDGLAPFDFAAATGSFDLWPFRAWFASGTAKALLAFDWGELFGRLFLYSALIWVIREWGATTTFAIAATVTCVLAIEILQLWLPGQDAAVTDPALALAIGLLFRYLDRRGRGRSLGAAIGPRVRSP